MRLFKFIVDAIRHIVEVIDDKIDAIQVDRISRKLDERAEQSDAKNWRTSVVDLMKLAGLDSSLANRRDLAKELGRDKFVGSADDNIWLHGRVLEALAEHDIRLPKD
jgi:hypothetical protein